MIFNIRVYGILINPSNEVLISDELINCKHYTKFPGGGLEFGEGIKDCLIREFKEETLLDMLVDEHIYTTDFFQVSAFNPQHQIISVYYLVKPKVAVDLMKYFQLLNNRENANEYFRWIDLKKLSKNDMSLPIDKIVVDLIKNKF